MLCLRVLTFMNAQLPFASGYKVIQSFNLLWRHYAPLNEGVKEGMLIGVNEIPALEQDLKIGKENKEREVLLR